MPIRTIIALCLLTALALPGCSPPTLAPSPNLYVDMDGDPFADVPEEYRSNLVPIIYATDRAPEEPGENGVPRYGYRRSKSTAYGTVTVAFDRELSWEDLVAKSRTHRRPGNVPMRIQSVDEHGRFPETPHPPALVDGKLVPDPETEAALAAARAEATAFFRERLSRTPRKEMILLVHGYNNTFEVAAFRMAQLWHFLGREGLPVAYTWPAGRGGALRGYNYDRESGEFTIHHLKRFIESAAAVPELERIHIIGHSRGTDVVTTALRELHIKYSAMGKDTGEALKLGHLILAAPDLDWEVVQQRIGGERLVTVPESFTIYLSAADKAIGLSEWLFDSLQRLGRLGAEDLTPAQRELIEQTDDLDLIDVTAKTDFLGHGYFVSNPAVLSDLILRLRYDRKAGPEHGRPLLDRGGGFWELPKGYPDFTPDVAAEPSSPDPE
jgi:esterase/lipase superfamily enzyme